MSLIQTHGVTVRFGAQAVLEQVDLTVAVRERICLVGRNGSGKSTLMRLLAGEMPPDAGSISQQPNLVVAQLPQQIPDFQPGTRVGDVALHRSSPEQDPQRVIALLQQFDLDAESDITTLSGGQQRRVLLVRTLATDADLLLLDEPTNHLDLAGIERLENWLLNYHGTVLFVTHDRRFLRALATRILELDRAQLTSWPGNYDTFLQRRQAMLLSEESEWQLFDRKLAQEEVWIRKGIKARRTRNEGRVRLLEEMRQQRLARRERQGRVRLPLQEVARSGQLVMAAENVSYGWQGEKLIDRFSTLILRQDKIGLIGPNGCGKSTLLNLLLGRLTPDSGRIQLGTRLEVAWFDQMRQQIDLERTVWENIADGCDRLTIGQQTQHVLGYLADFLFTPDRARSPAKTLSGGERNRLLLARLFTRPANLLVMDEPTNDLDSETLELLEERLIHHKGCVLLVSHDREFLDNVVTSVLVFEGDGRIQEYAGGYSDWQQQRNYRDATSSAPVVATATVKNERPRRQREVRQLTFREQQQLAELPTRIETLEAEQHQLHQQLANPDCYQSGDQPMAVELQRTAQRLEQIEQQLADCYQQWEALETKAAELEARND
ncbi:MAG: ATP-binding cassette domain-containing protein [Magnetococcales bacterium]|nr:ATP-binding cassette domain-containing protein [Magnetococcales bacterium]